MSVKNYLNESLLSIFCFIIDRNGSSVKGLINSVPDNSRVSVQ